ncbi:Phosphatidylinositol mannoside acyltransferase [Frankia sp. AiPs1]|uniref:phosphatidylinositol mannoside acyltransferase n=1 Tax=Frankia sp. AiPa1 TaxID=573492 RepID=UPI00202B3A16|nr:phosphatidylinositol mannoside acyltransferase [Frankia sp. AiPa1]MCL9758013.1 phosphatidylinositol mannoside acyltransferase [Frankia sp. AiPa1]
MSAGRLTDLAYALGWRGVRLLPEPLAAAGFRMAADLAWRRDGRGVRRLRANLARVAPAGTDLDRLTRAAMRSYARYWMEVFRLTDLGTERIIGQMRLVDEHLLRDAHAQGAGTILALPHMGNWEQAGAWLVATGIPFTTVAERLRPESLFERFLAFRTALGMEVIALTGGESPPYGLLAARLRAGGMLCLLADRDLSRAGVPVRFFGSTATMPGGPAALALDTGAVLLPVTLWFDRDGWSARIHPAVAHSDVATMTQGLADAFAAGIAAHPADWHMLQRVWRDDVGDGTRPSAGAPLPAAQNPPAAGNSSAAVGISAPHAAPPMPAPWGP